MLRKLGLANIPGIQVEQQHKPQAHHKDHKEKGGKTAEKN